MQAKRYYIIIALVVAAVIALLLMGGRSRQRTIDDRITLNKKHKTPYGAYIAYHHLSYLFPDAVISSDHREPGYWDSLSNYDGGQALLVITPSFDADAFEMKKIIRFVENGNDVFVSARQVSPDVQELIHGSVSVVNSYMVKNDRGEWVQDSLDLQLVPPVFQNRQRYEYPGAKFSSWLYTYDSSMAVKLGTDEIHRTNFIRLSAGKGHFYLHLSPLAFSNYFLLHGQNMRYYENVLSVISPDVKRVVWDEYFINRKPPSPDEDEENEGGEGFLTKLMNYPEFKWAFLIGLLALLLYVLSEMRRKQRAIPVIPRSKNESLDFVKTIGRLYYDKGDHLNLARKMTAHFREYIRHKYKLLTSEMNEEWVQRLQYKSGYDGNELNAIVTFIRNMEQVKSISQAQVADFYRRLEAFYKNT